MKIRICTNLIAGVVSLFVVGFAETSHAYVYIMPGSSIQFIGGAILNGPIGSATAYTSIFATSVLPGSQTGDYATVPGLTPVTVNSFTFNPAPVSSFPMWNFTVGPTVYSFQVDANSVTVNAQNSQFLNISGTGMAHIDGFLDTSGVWSISDTGIGSAPVFTFGASTTVIPEPSAAALMMGLAMLLVPFAFRKKAKA